ncbi:MAG: LacI family DNA-binding transcriptional regulator [Capsulimonadaceae bacterium]
MNSAEIKAVTRQDIAKASHVSVSTVSHVLNSSPRKVSAQTRDRVLAAATRMQYQGRVPEHSRRDPITHTIGIISTSFLGSHVLFNPFSVGIIGGIFDVAEERDYNVTLFTNKWTNRDISGHWLTERMTDGIIVLAPSIHRDLVETLLDAGIPTMTVAADACMLGTATVDVDNDKGTILLVEHLIGLGHRRIAHIAGHPSVTSTFIRRDAYFRAMLAHGLEVPDDYVVEGAYIRDLGYTCAKRLLSLPDRPTAIFAANDDMAVGALLAAADLGLRVPEDASVVGYDDAPYAAQNNMTTVRQPLNEMGRLATTLLFQKISGLEVEAKTFLLQPELILRGSAAAPPASYIE